MVNKLSIKYFQLITKNANENCNLPIYMRITLNRKKSELHTGFSVLAKNWSQLKQESKVDFINLDLLKKRTRVYELMVELQNKNKPVTATLLKELLIGKQKIETGLIAYFSKYVDELTIKNEIKKLSIDKFRQSIRSLESFLQTNFNTKEMSMDQIDYSFINAYDLFLKGKNNLHRNTINKYHSRLKTILIKALNEAQINKNPYNNFKLKTQKSNRKFLPQEELNKIIILDLSHNQSLDRVRDIFLFSCYTGLRFQDSQNLSTENLVINDKNQSIRFVQEKTNVQNEIPLFDIAKNIIEKYKDSNERIVLKKLLPKISNQKVNAYLKIIGDLSELNQELTHHIARHTFATTILLNNNMPIELVSKLLGHTNIKTTQIYGKITQEYLRNQMNTINKKL